MTTDAQGFCGNCGAPRVAATDAFCRSCGADRVLQDPGEHNTGTPADLNQTTGARSVAPRPVGGGATLLFIEQSYPRGELETATQLRRLGAYALDLLIGTVTLYVGWLIWSLAVAQYGQTPGKQLTRLYVMRKDASRAGGWYTILRELLIKHLFFGAVSVAVLPLFTIAGLWCTWDKERQTLWDKVVTTHVAYSPSGFRPLTAAENITR